MKNLAIIPARGGSKRLPGKNIKSLCGKPLVIYTLEAVKNSERFDTIILSSDDDKILDIGSQVKNITLEKRDPQLAQDQVKVIDLVQSIARRPGYTDLYDTIGLFLPTCPFRTKKHIQEGLNLLKEDDFSVISVTPMTEHVALSLTINDDQTMNAEAIMKPSPLITGETRSQDFKQVYRVNGGFYISWIKKFIQKKNFFQGRVKSYVMPSLYSSDIDNQLDFEWAEFLLGKNYIDFK